METLVIDNYDSFTWNLVQYIAELNREEPLVVRNDEYCWSDVLEMGKFRNIVISPGPGSVDRPGDFGISRSAIEQGDIPILGVCLGHQGIAYVNGGRIAHAPEPVHGRVSQVVHDQSGIFRGIPTPFNVVRYHSLVVEEPLPDCLVPVARTDSGLLMAIRHRIWPQWGVQFHPESILTQYGKQLIGNFLDLSHSYHRRTGNVTRLKGNTSRRSKGSTRHVIAREVHSELGAEDLFVGLHADSENAFWLDSAFTGRGLARFSFLGQAGSEGVVSHSLSGNMEDRERQGREFMSGLEDRTNESVEGGDELPFEFRGGWVGYFGFEMKSLFGGEVRHRNGYPDAIWMHVDRFIAIDHECNKVWLVAIGNAKDNEDMAKWISDTNDVISTLGPAPPPVIDGSREELSIKVDQSRSDYIDSIEACRNAIREGDSYELCLTNKLTVSGRPDGCSLYRLLRSLNPAPYAAYIRVGDLDIVSSSPERFIAVDASGKMQAKPIKGTIRRGRDAAQDKELAESLARSEKDRAENLMIVDLLRNDLGRVATTGSVRVPGLMEIESYATVHQLVSTVEAKLRPDQTLIDVVSAAFPGGSISGAPKIRTLQILDEREISARGVYCGSIGYLGYNRVMDLNIAIRTLVSDGNDVSFGVGGAITYLSNSNDEFEETMLKAQALIRVLAWYWCGKDRQNQYRIVESPRSRNRLDIGVGNAVS